MVMEVKLLQPSKQYPPKLVTELGMVMEVKLVHLEKHHHPKLVTDSGIWLFLQPAIILFVEDSMIALQFSLESYTGLSAATTILSRPSQ